MIQPPPYISRQLFDDPAPIAGLHLVAHTGLHGIGLPDGNVACEIALSSVEQPWDIQAQRIEAHSLQQFANGYLPQIFPWDSEYDRNAVVQRALASIGRSSQGIVARNGDNFARWCVTGSEIPLDTSIFGQQLAAKRLGGIYEHHGVGIDGGYVVHFNRPSTSGGKHIVHVVPFNRFAGDSEVVIVQSGQRYSPLQARNRALNMIGWGEYDLLDNNCEHVASWCVTGLCKCEKVKAVKVGLAVTAVTALGAAIAYFLSKEESKNE